MCKVCPFYADIKCTKCDRDHVLECPAGSLIVRDLDECWSSCKPGYYQPIGENECKLCRLAILPYHEQCRECGYVEGNLECTKCVASTTESYYLINGTCYAESDINQAVCSTGQYPYNGGCATCPPGCSACYTGSECLSCENGYYLTESSQCVQLNCDTYKYVTKVTKSHKLEQITYTSEVCNDCVASDLPANCVDCDLRRWSNG